MEIIRQQQSAASAAEEAQSKNQFIFFAFTSEGHRSGYIFSLLSSFDICMYTLKYFRCVKNLAISAKKVSMISS